MTQPDVPKKERIAWGALLLAALAANLVYGFGFSITEGVWFDEALTTYFISLSWAELGHFISRYEANMALYYALLKLWSAFSFSESWLRLFSLGAYGLAIWLFSRTLRDHFGPRAAFAFVVLMLVHFFLVRFSVEIRGYALALFFMALLWFSWVRANLENNRGYWWLYAVAGALGVHSHFFVALGVFALGVVALFNIRGQAKYWWAAHLLIGASFLPILVFVAFKESGQLAWIETPGIKSLIYLFFEFSGGASQAPDAIRHILAVSGLAGLVFALLATRPEGSTLMKKASKLHFVMAATVTAGLPVLLVFGVSQVEPIFAGRFFVPFVAFYLMLVAIGIVHVSRQWALVPVSAMAVLLVLSSNSYSQREPNRWAAPYEHVFSQCEPGDGVLFMGPRTQAAINFYERQTTEGCQFETVLPYKLTPATYFRTHEEYPQALFKDSELTRLWVITTHASADDVAMLKQYRQQAEEAVGECRTAFQNEAIHIDLCG